MLAAFLTVCRWVLLQQGLAFATYDAFNQPVLLLLILVVAVFSAASMSLPLLGPAAPRDRARWGAGICLVWRALYADVTGQVPALAVSTVLPLRVWVRPRA